MNNESSEVIDILLPVTFILNLRQGLIMSKTSDDSLLPPPHPLAPYASLRGAFLWLRFMFTWQSRRYERTPLVAYFAPISPYNSLVYTVFWKGNHLILTLELIIG